jgi:exopolysaccharide biosynthesis protein
MIMRRQLLNYTLPLLLVGCAESLPSRSGSETVGNSPIAGSGSPGATPTATATPATPTATPLKPNSAALPNYKTQALSNGTAHIMTIPSDSRYVVKPVIASDLQTVGQFAKSSGAIAAINGGFFDPKNQQTTSYVVMNQKIVADPKQNPQLTENPKLKQYLRQIFDRSEFQRYDCGGKVSYGIQSHSKPAPEGCQIVDAIGGGPQLLPDVQAQREGFTDPELGRDAIGSQVGNARSAIGITKDNGILLVMVAQKQPKSGVTLAELATLMKSLGAESAMNLDGGSSSAIVYDGKAMIGAVGEDGKVGERAVKSAIVVVGQ